jgi:hypothetical protein
MLCMRRFPVPLRPLCVFNLQLYIKLKVISEEAFTQMVTAHDAQVLLSLAPMMFGFTTDINETDNCGIQATFALVGRG